jgi:predicted ATPase
LTIAGPGGAGKTRFAIELASRQLERFPNGVFWVPLAPLRDPALVLETAAQTLGAKDGLAEHIADRRLLLLLDNFEQVVGAAPDVSELLRSCPNLAVLVTTRELLRIEGERKYLLPPLPPSEAVALFCERAEVDRDVTIDELCARLEGLPLAIELAASRADILSPAQLLARLSQRLDLLKGGRDADPRQQTLRATIEWSHDLLEEEERRLFRRLAVFVGGCTLDGAEAVAGADIDGLASLLDKSLLRSTGERYWMLETLREYAAERLAVSGEADDKRRRHAGWFLALAEEADPNLRLEGSIASLDRLEAERDNLRAALEWAREADNGEVELRLAAALKDFWLQRGPYSEGRKWLEEAAIRAGAEFPARGADALSVASFIAYRQGENAASKSLALRELEIAQALGDPAKEAAALSNLANVVLVDGDFEQANELYRECIELAREAGDHFRVAVSIHNLGDAALAEGDYEAAVELCEESLALYRNLGYAGGEAASLVNLGSAYLHLDHHDDARRCYEAGLRVATELADVDLIGNFFEGFAGLAAAAGIISERPAC